MVYKAVKFFMNSPPMPLGTALTIADIEPSTPVRRIVIVAALMAV